MFERIEHLDLEIGTAAAAAAAAEDVYSAEVGIGGRSFESD